MDHYDLFLSKLKGMQTQGYPKQQILDEWKKHSPKVLHFLEKLLVIAKLKDDRESVSSILSKMKRLKNLQNTIQIGLLE